MKKRDANYQLFKEKVSRQFGGARLRSHPKNKRPLSTKHAIHLVLKSELARGIKFWQARPFTRLVSWGRDYSRVKHDMEKNRAQAFTDWGFSVVNPLEIEFLKTG